MLEQPRLDLYEIFSAVLQALRDQRLRLNQADTVDGNHGDHMVAIFEVAVRTAQSEQAAGSQGADLSQVMLQASRQLEALPDNDSAHVYGVGLSLLAARLQEHRLSLQDLVSYTASQLKPQEEGENSKTSATGREKDVVKALLDALADWDRYEASREKDTGEPQSQTGMDLGYLFGAGMAYLQARQKGGERLDILVETAVNASPLGRVLHRAESGRLVIRTLLRAMTGGLPTKSS